MHVLFSSKNPASGNIARRLVEMGFSEVSGSGFSVSGNGKQDGGNPEVVKSSRTSPVFSAEKRISASHLRGDAETGNWMWKGHRMIDTKAESILEVPTDFETDWLLVLSTHRSEKKFPAFTVHIPGNWDKAEMGGEPRTLNVAYASRMKDLLRALSEKNALGWNVNQEVDHHGPTCKLPIIFIEIGSSEEEWGNRKAAEIVAEAVMDSINEKKLYPSYIGAGGGHYAPFFTKLMLEGEEAFGHILPKYQAANVGADTLKQAMGKNVEKVDTLIYEHKSFKAPERDRLFAIAKEIGLGIEVR